MYNANSFVWLTRNLSTHLDDQLKVESGTESADWRFDVMAIILCGALAGASVGAWMSGLQLFYVATKIPLLLLGTLLIGLPSMALFGRLTGCSLGFTDCANLALFSIARTAIVLGALSPATTYFAFTLPTRGQSAYRVIVLSQVLVFALAGFVGVATLKNKLAGLVPNHAKRYYIMSLWMAIYSFVGAQLTWMMRPFLGNPGMPVEYFRSYGERIGVNSNFYLSVFTLIKHSLGW